MTKRNRKRWGNGEPGKGEKGQKLKRQGGLGAIRERIMVEFAIL
jgi:hypothetical protein